MTTNLTPREHDILVVLCQGSTNRDIGMALEIGEQVVKNYLRTLFIKTGSKNRVELATWFIKRNRSNERTT